MIARLLGVVVALLGGSLFAQQADVVVRVRSLAPFTASWLQCDQELGTALPSDSGESSPLLDVGEEPVVPDWVHMVLLHRHAEAIAAGRLVVVMTRKEKVLGDLVLRGPRADVDACERDLDAIARSLGRAIEVTAWCLPLGAGALPATAWDASELQQALRDRPPTWTARARVRSGAALRLAKEVGIGYLRDVDVEVAGSKRVHDPKVDRAFAGARATCRVDAAPGNGIVLKGSWLLSEPVGLREQDTGGLDISVELPEHRSAFVTFAGRVPDGGALVVAGRGGPVGPEGFLLVLGARFLQAEAPDQAPGLLVRPAGALLWKRTLWPQFGWREPGDDSWFFAAPACDGGLDADGLPDLLTLAEGQYGWAGRSLVMYGDPQVLRQADALLAAMFETLRPASLVSRVSSADAPVLELAQPALAGQAAAAFVGTERAVLRDSEVEIAGGSAVQNPVIGIVRSGMWLGAMATRDEPDWHMTGRWSIAAYDEPRARLLDDAEAAAVLQLVHYRTTTLPWDAPMPRNQAHTLGDGPAWTARGPATHVAVQLNAR